MRLVLVLVMLLISGCASYYISSVPGNAKVYLEDPRTGGKYYLGETPIKIPKGRIDVDYPFYLVFEKGGYEVEKVPVAPLVAGDVIIDVRLKSTGAGSEEVRFAQGVLRRFYEAQKLVARGEYHEALSVLNGIMKEFGEFPEVYMLRGSIYKILKEEEKAIEDWKKASEMRPEDKDLSEALSEILKEKEREVKEREK